MRKIILNLIFGVLISGIILIPESIYAQSAGSKVHGFIKDKADNSPLVGASIYFAATTIGTMADKKGEYELVVTKPGNYEMIVSMVGYEMKTQSVYVEAGRNYLFNFELEPKELYVKTVEVEGKDQTEWKNNLEIFKKALLGGNRTASYCEFDNTNNSLEYIEFSQTGNFLSAKCNKPFKLINNYTGYIIDFTMSMFDYNPESLVLIYSIYPRFTEMTPENENQKQKWEDQRKEIYYGSPTHFLKTLINNTFKRDGYTVEKISTYNPVPGNRMEFSISAKDEIEEWQELRAEEVEFENPVLTFDKFLKVTYKKDQISYITLKYKYFSIDKNGVADKHLPFLSYGYWGKLGLADLLPRDYSPEPEN